jgi:hypothetical protein
LCGSEWFYPEIIELSSVEFRCSASGAKFNVISSRRSPLHKFTVHKIEKAVKAARSPEVGPSASSSILNSHRAPLALTSAAPRGGWLARILGRKADLETAKLMSETPNNRPTPVAVSTTTNDADEYNWNGFSCPYCDAHSFISCAGGHLACDGTIRVRKDGRFHQCFCGHAAFIVGTIKTFENERLRRIHRMRRLGIANRKVMGPLTPPFHLQPDLCRQSDNLCCSGLVNTERWRLH